MIKEICGFIDDDGNFYKSKEDYEKTLLSNQYDVELDLLAEEVVKKILVPFKSKTWTWAILKYLIESDIDINKLNELREVYKLIES